MFPCLYVMPIYEDLLVGRAEIADEYIMKRWTCVCVSVRLCVHGVMAILLG